MRVGLVCPYDLGVPGGVQQQVGELAIRLRSQGDDPIVVGAGTAPTAVDLDDVPFIGSGPSVTVRGNRSRAPVALQPAAWGRARAALEDVDVVHVHEPLVPLAGWAALSLAKPIVATFHADAPSWARRLYRWAPLVGRRLEWAVVTAVSEVAARAVPSRWGPVEIIPNGVDVESFHLPVARAMSRVAFLGRDEPRKGLDLLLEVWPEISRQRPDAELVVMGADRGIPPPGVTYLGRVSATEKRRVLASSAVYVAPNTGGESFGIVIAEAMAAGCAVVASDLASFQAVLGEAGRPFPAGDRNALRDVVVDLLGDREALAAMGEKGRREVRRFDWAEVASEYRSAYRRALAG